MTAVSPLSIDQIRDIDRRAIEEFGLPGMVLMENAGRGCAELLLNRGVNGPVIICCGPGNNGGDGYVIARHLELAGCRVRVLVFADPDRLRGDAAVNFQVLQRSDVPIDCFPAPPPPAALDALLSSASWIVDALLGTGTHGSVREPCRTAIQAINRSGRRVLAVDLPSGLEADSGHPLDPCLRAHLTATFVAPKLGFSTPQAQERLGEVITLSIGAPRKLLAEYGLSRYSAGAAPA